MAALAMQVPARAALDFDRAYADFRQRFIGAAPDRSEFAKFRAVQP